MSELSPPPHRRRRRTPTLVLSGVAVAAVGAATAAAVGFGGGDQGTADAAALPPETATVDRETLRDVRSEEGTLGYGSETAVKSGLAGTVTALPETGAAVGRGEILYEIDEVPVVLMYGSVPAYRSLAPGAEGADVEQLEQNLEKLDYTGFTVDDEYTGGTAAAVEQWQEDLGLPVTGTVDQGRVVFAPAALRVATHNASVGDVLQPGGAVLAWTGTDRVVTVELDVDDRPLAEPGTAVTVTLPDGSSHAGEVAGAETVVETSDEQAPPGEEAAQETVLEVTVALDDQDAVEGYDQASVDVGFVAGEREDVLTVPVAALLALSEGGYGVEVVEGSSTRIVAVDTGLFASGRVEVSGEGLSEGMTVGMPS
jgi:peptidoglycan hydrolase-like protein with peptidoglycan-binding domain